MLECKQCGRTKFIEIISFKEVCKEFYDKLINYRCVFCGQDIETKQSVYIDSMWLSDDV